MNSPSTLYHYTSLEAAIKILQSSTMYASDARCMNDLEEGIWYRTVLSTELSKNYNMSEAFMSALKDECQRVLSHWITYRNRYIVSFCENRDQLSQWRAYCKDGGVSLGFNKSTIESKCASDGFQLVQCNYNSEELSQYTQRTIKEFLILFPESFPAQPYNREGLMNGLWEFFNASSVTFKHHSWHEEKEWRLASFPEGFDPTVSLSRSVLPKEWRTSDGRLIAFARIEIDVKNSLSEILISPNSRSKIDPNMLSDFCNALGIKANIEVSDCPLR